VCITHSNAGHCGVDGALSCSAIPLLFPHLRCVVLHDGRQDDWSCFSICRLEKHLSGSTYLWSVHECFQSCAWHAGHCGEVDEAASWRGNGGADAGRLSAARLGLSDG
jgi:hypothetical protein